MKILLTGGRGFIGRNIAEQLGARHEIISPSHREIDYTDYGAMLGFFKANNFEAVIHSAAAPTHRAAKNTENAVITNLLMYATLLKCAAECGVKRFINIGSGSEYDTSRSLCDVSEEDFGRRIPRDITGFPKYLENFITEPGIRIYNLRCFGVFGKYEDYTIRFISNAICRALCGYSITLRQDRVFSYLYVDDLAEIVESFLTMDFKYRDYNITPHEKWSLLDIARLVRKICHRDIQIDLANQGKGPEYTGSNARLCAELNFAFTPMVDAVKLLHDWYVLNFDTIDREKILYSI